MTLGERDRSDGFETERGTVSAVTAGPASWGAHDDRGRPANGI